MKKPVILHTEASNGWGGQEIRIVAEMLGMKGRGHEVFLATPEEGLIYKRARQAGIETFPVGMDKSSLINSVLAIKRIIKEKEVSIINTHSSKDSWAGSIAGRISGIKVLRTRHISAAMKSDPFKRLVYGPLCDGIITTGEAIKAMLVRELKLNPDKIHSIPTGIDAGRFSGADGSGVRASLGIGPGEPVIGIVAVLRSWKGHEYLVKAMPKVLKEFPDAKLLIAGEGPVRPHLERWVGELGIGGNVLLLGHREDVPEVMQAIDIAVLSSYASEGIPQTILQAMASGKPVIGTDVGGIPEVVKDGVTGIIVPPRDSDSLADAIRFLLKDKERLRLMGEAGRESVLKGHTMDKMLDDLEAFYESVLS